MKFIFRSPALEIEAPILNDETVGYQASQRVEPFSHICVLQLLQQNGACVFLGRIYNILPRGPGGPMRPQVDIIGIITSLSFRHIIFLVPW